MVGRGEVVCVPVFLLERRRDPEVGGPGGGRNYLVFSDLISAGHVGVEDRTVGGTTYIVSFSELVGTVKGVKGGRGGVTRVFGKAHPAPHSFGWLGRRTDTATAGARYTVTCEGVPAL